MKLILASLSPARRSLLEAAGLVFEVEQAVVDEEQAKAEFRSNGMTGQALAEALADAKASGIKDDCAQTLVLGCDQVLIGAGGRQIDKVRSRDALRDQLAALAGQTHHLVSAAAIRQHGRKVWAATESVAMTMRPLSTAFIDDYVAQADDGLLGCVGGYQIEGRGVHLFESITGSHFAILGLPLLPLLDYLRMVRFLPS
jgi:septum formation protein